MGQYIRDQDVIIRLHGKVRFTEDLTEENKMPIVLLRRLISEAEGEVEQDLSPRYAAPFHDKDGLSFAALPDRPTKELLRTLCELAAVARVLETDFGRGSATEGDKYAASQRKRYEQLVAKHLEVRDGQYLHWVYPPLPGLAVNYQNTSDDGFQGEIIVTSQFGDRASYPSKQINDPSMTFFGGEIDE
jgi:hypothetical protein